MNNANKDSNKDNNSNNKIDKNLNDNKEMQIIELYKKEIILSCC